MASTCLVSMAMTMPLTHSTQNNQLTSHAFFSPLPVKHSKAISISKPVGKLHVHASLKEKAVTGLTAAALTASMIVPDVAEAATGLSPSLNNFLLSIAAGGIVLAGIGGAIIGVSNFDPVKRA